ncbi:hypothetical protein Hdeb2414_s0010g00341171 [Helianthus debilis subsp. tardiflorus]
MTGNVILHDWYSLSRKEEEYDRLKSKVATTTEKIQATKERLAIEKAGFEAYKRTEEWAVVAGHKQEMVNLKSANASVEKKKVVAILTMEEAIAGRNTTVQALEEANVGHTSVVKVLKEAKLAYATLEVRDATMADVNRRLVEAEARAVKAEEERDDATSMNANLVADRAWMRNLGVVLVANAILDAPENTNAPRWLTAREKLGIRPAILSV